jgi:hypothetical protein
VEFGAVRALQRVGTDQAMPGAADAPSTLEMGGD